jgi:hypothetical protein
MRRFVMWFSIRCAAHAFIATSVALIALSSHADIVKGPYTLADDAFVDALIGTGGVVVPFTAPDVATGLTDTSLATSAMLKSIDAYVDLEFTDNVAVNGAGADIIIFERYGATAFNATIEIGGVTNTVIGGGVFAVDGENTNATLIDLSDFGYLAGESVTTLRLSFAQSPSVISGVAALNSSSGIDVELDIKPSESPNPVNPFIPSLIPVAILGSDTFDVADVDVTTLAYGPFGVAPVHAVGGHLDDVNGDSFTDLVSHYQNNASGIAFGDVEACVTGETLDAIAFVGCDAIETVPLCGDGLAVAFVVPALVWRHERRKRAAR